MGFFDFLTGGKDKGETAPNSPVTKQSIFSYKPTQFGYQPEQIENNIPKITPPKQENVFSYNQQQPQIKNTTIAPTQNKVEAPKMSIFDKIKSPNVPIISSDDITWWLDQAEKSVQEFRTAVPNYTTWLGGSIAWWLSTLALWWIHVLQSVNAGVDRMTSWLWGILSTEPTAKDIWEFGLWWIQTVFNVAFPEISLWFEMILEVPAVQKGFEWFEEVGADEFVEISKNIPWWNKLPEEQQREALAIAKFVTIGVILKKTFARMKTKKLSTTEWAIDPTARQKAVAILEIQPWETYKQAFKRLAKERHPDRPGWSTEAFQEINEAYQVLEWKIDFSKERAEVPKADKTWVADAVSKVTEKIMKPKQWSVINPFKKEWSFKDFEGWELKAWGAGAWEITPKESVEPQKFADFIPEELAEQKKVETEAEKLAVPNFADTINTKEYDSAQKKIQTNRLTAITESEYNLLNPAEQQMVKWAVERSITAWIDKQNTDFKETVKEVLKSEEQERKLSNMTPEKSKLEYRKIEKARERIMEEMVTKWLARDTNEAKDLYDKMTDLKPKAPKARAPKERIEGLKVIWRGGNYFAVIDWVQGKKAFRTSGQARNAGELILKDAKLKKESLEKGIGQKKLEQPMKLTPNEYDALSWKWQKNYTELWRNYKKQQKGVAPKKKLITRIVSGKEAIKLIQKEWAKITKAQAAKPKAGEIKVSDKERARLKGISTAQFQELVAKDLKKTERKKKKLLREKFKETPRQAYPLVKETAISKLFPLLYFEWNTAGLEWIKAYEWDIPAPRSTADEANSIISKAKWIAQPLATQIRDISPEIFKIYERTEFKLNNKSQRRAEFATPGIKILAEVKKNKKDRDNLTIALANADDIGLRTIRTLSKKYPGLEKQIEFIRAKVFRDWLALAKKVGFDLSEIKAYRPRKIRDSIGLFKAIEERVGTENFTQIQRAIIERAAKLNLNGEDLPFEEKVRIANSMMRGFSTENINVWSNTFKKRKLNVMNKDLAQYYHDPMDSLLMYIKNVPTSIYFKEMFGWDNKNMDIMEDSLGAAVLELGEKNGLDIKEQMRLKKLLKARLDHSATSATVSRLKNATYLATLANPLATLTQFGDLAFPIYENGAMMTLKAMVNKKWIKMEDVGILSYNIDMIDNKLSRKRLDKSLKLVGFTSVDRFGKEVMINATLYNLAERSVNDPAKIMAELGESGLEAKAPDIIKRLQTVYNILHNAPEMLTEWGKKLSKKQRNKFYSDEIKKLMGDDISQILWKKVGKYQPIYEGRMSPLYLTANGRERMLFQLKTFNISALDGLINEGRKEFKKADATTNKAEKARHRVKGAKNMVKLAMLLTAFGYTQREIKDFFKGKNRPRTKLMADSFLSIIGLSTYDFGPIAYNTTRVEELSQQFIVPPSLAIFSKMVESISYLVTQTLKWEEINLKKVSILRNMPLFGDLLYQRLNKDTKPKDIWDQGNIWDQRSKDIWK